MSDTVFFTQAAPRATLAKAARTRILTTAAAAFAVLREWRHRFRSRRELASYSYYERNDLGFAAEVDAEIAKPFWKK
jgi:uncharacterized protein YjiS (DUF1127 family)